MGRVTKSGCGVTGIRISCYVAFWVFLVLFCSGFFYSFGV